MSTGFLPYRVAIGAAAEVAGAVRAGRAVPTATVAEMLDGDRRRNCGNVSCCETF